MSVEPALRVSVYEFTAGSIKVMFGFDDFHEVELSPGYPLTLFTDLRAAFCEAVETGDFDGYDISCDSLHLGKWSFN